MNKVPANRGFVPGLIAGVVVGGAAGLALAALRDGSTGRRTLEPAFTALHGSLNWASANLGFALPVFAIVLILFAGTLSQLKRRIRTGQPLDEVAQTDHLCDTWTSLFFGVGVIWTAIGMRGALLFALGDPADTARDGAFAVLQRMVDGGILVALSTTIFGGIGGYILRVIKTVSVGGELKRYYEAATRQSADDVQASLQAIEGHLQRLTPQEASARQAQEKPHGPIAVD